MSDPYRLALEAALPILERAARHLDVDRDCWFSCRVQDGRTLVRWPDVKERAS